MFNIGTPELIIILAIALIVFGPKKLPEIGRSIGQGLRELRKASRDIMDSVNLADEPFWAPESTSRITNVPDQELADEAAVLPDEDVQSAKENIDNAADSDRND